jgi:tetratricopeptide (TPR) repeat protein
MNVEKQQPEYHALLASRLRGNGIEDLRARIWEQGNRGGTPVWVSEIDAKDEFAGKDLDFIQVACLKQVRSAPKFICLLDGSYGTTWNEGQISILELELATAAFSQRDIWIFLLAPFDQPDPRIESLLKVISCSAARIKGPVTHDEVLANIGRLLEPVGQAPETLRIGPLVADLAHNRSPRLNFDLNVRDVQFLGGAFAPLLIGRPDKDRIAKLLAEAEKETVMPDKLAKLWVAIRHLSAAPFTERHNEEYLPLWERALAQWSSASAWYGLHGHFLLGRLAAVNSLSIIRQRMPDWMQNDLGPPSIFADAGAAASEYYSIAKLVPSIWQRYCLLRKALWNCNAALSEGAVSDHSGLLDIRGHVKLRMFNPVGGLSDLRQSLAIRMDNGQSPGRIGESEVHLGRAYAECRQYRKAERYLESGVARLRTSGNQTFFVQGLRHLALFYTRLGRRVAAIEALTEAQDIAKRHEIHGQLQQIEHELSKLYEEP